MIKLLAKCIGEYKRDSILTSINADVIAHRLSTVRNADEIMVLEKGHII